jgi:hypothetical protein
MANIIKYDPTTVWPKILEGIASGESLSSILRQPEMPSYAWAKLQLRENDDLRRAYDQATQDRADRLVEQLVELADSPVPVGLDGPALSAWVQQLRLKVDVRKWAASKLKPRSYGDRLDVSVDYQQISLLPILALAQQRVHTIDAE